MRKTGEQVIGTIKDKTVMFINGNDDRYTSKYLDEDMAANYVNQIPNIYFVASMYVQSVRAF